MEFQVTCSNRKGKTDDDYNIKKEKQNPIGFIPKGFYFHYLLRQ
jgi:hypothetical protein